VTELLTCARVRRASSSARLLHLTTSNLTVKTRNENIRERIVTIMMGALLVSGVTRANRFPVGAAGNGSSDMLRYIGLGNQPGETFTSLRSIEWKGRGIHD
jgi:hypothetical protein